MKLLDLELCLLEFVRLLSAGGVGERRGRRRFDLLDQVIRLNGIGRFCWNAYNFVFLYVDRLPLRYLALLEDGLFCMTRWLQDPGSDLLRFISVC